MRTASIKNLKKEGFIVEKRYNFSDKYNPKTKYAYFFKAVTLDDDGGICGVLYSSCTNDDDENKIRKWYVE